MEKVESFENVDLSQDVKNCFNQEDDWHKESLLKNPSNAES